MKISKNVAFIGLLIFIFLNLNGCGHTSNKKDPKVKKAELYYSHGTEFLVKKNYSQALKLLLQAQELTPNDSKVLNNLAMAYFFKKKIHTAIEFLKKSITINPKNSDARNNLASIYFREGNYKEAEHQYNLVKGDLIYPHQYRTYYNLALIAEKRGDTKKMTNLLELSIKENDSYCPGHFKLGKINFKQKNYATSLKYLKKASIGTCYNNAAPTFYQGLIWRKLQDDEKAMGKFKEIINSFPKSDYVKAAQANILELRKNNPGIILKDDLIPELPEKIKSLEF